MCDAPKRCNRIDFFLPFLASQSFFFHFYLCWFLCDHLAPVFDIHAFGHFSSDSYKKCSNNMNSIFSCGTFYILLKAVPQRCSAFQFVAILCRLNEICECLWKSLSRIDFRAQRNILTKPNKWEWPKTEGVEYETQWNLKTYIQSPKYTASRLHFCLIIYSGVVLFSMYDFIKEKYIFAISTSF